jgi:F-type H+-transporting ATPase subunit gamma
MATLREIKRRITGVQNTQQITKAMKMVAAAKLRKAQDRMINSRPYSRKISEMLYHLLQIEKNIQNPLTEKRDVNRMALVVVTSDRGLCGSFNINVIRRVEELLNDDFSELQKNGNLDLYFIGKKALDHFKSRNYEIKNSYINVTQDLKFEFAAQFVAELSKRFLDREIDKVEIVSNEFVSVMQQNVKSKQLLPIEPAAFETKEEEDVSTSAEYIYEPDKVSIINSLLPRYLNAQMWQVLLESYAAELGARMTAMDMATENANELIHDLRMTYNKERQASITKEILEIVSGANALSG